MCFLKTGFILKKVHIVSWELGYNDNIEHFIFFIFLKWVACVLFVVFLANYE